MCGRFTVALSYEQLKSYVNKKYQINYMPAFNLPRYNVAPGTNIISLISDGKKYRIGELKWGFIPKFKTEKPLKIINAQAESIFLKPIFRESAYNRRCIIIADSFYEWNKYDKADFPRRIMKKDNQPFSMAGIWNSSLVNNKKVYSVAIITVAANELLNQIHSRMPAILDEESEAIWLDSNIKDKNTLSNALLKYPSEKLKMYSVSKRVNTPKNDDINLLEKI